MSTLPELTRQVDDAFTETWYEIRPDAIDNILDATVVWAALKGLGCLKTQVGGEFITRTIAYGTESAIEVEKGDVLSQGEPELETVAMWNWRYTSSHVQRSLFDDQKNAGKSKIKDYKAKRLKAARRSLVDLYETNLFRDIDTTETVAVHKGNAGLNDVIAPYASYATGTHGKIERSNTWWQNKYKALTLPIAVNLLSDMRNLFNTVQANQEPPNLIITDQTLFEMYEDFGVDAIQIIKDESSRLVDLGFTVQRFKGKPMIWTDNVQISSASQMLFLTTEFIEIVYDPNMWFDMTNWKDIPLQATRIAHILSAMQMIGTQPRKQGRLYTA